MLQTGATLIYDYDSISIIDTAAGIGPAKSASPGYLRFSILFPDVLVDITDVSLDRKSIDHEGKHQHDTYIDKCHPEITREEPSCDKAKQHYDPGEDKVFNDVAHYDRERQVFIEKEIYNRNYQCEAKKRQHEGDLCRYARPDDRQCKYRKYHQCSKYACIF